MARVLSRRRPAAARSKEAAKAKALQKETAREAAAAAAAAMRDHVTSARSHKTSLERARGSSSGGGGDEGVQVRAAARSGPREAARMRMA